MNFTQVGAYAPTMSMHQLSTNTKFPAGGQVLGMITGGADGTPLFVPGAPTTPHLITLPITVSGSKDQEQQTQMIQIQVVGPAANASGANSETGGVPAKYVMPIQIQGFPQALFTLACNQPVSGEPMQLQLQPAISNNNNNNNNNNTTESDSLSLEQVVKNSNDIDDKSTQTMITRDIKTEISEDEEEDVNADCDAEGGAGGAEGGEEDDSSRCNDDGTDDLNWSDYLTAKAQQSASQNTLPLSLHHFLRFNGDNIRRGDEEEGDLTSNLTVGLITDETSTVNGLPPAVSGLVATTGGTVTGAKGKTRRRRKADGGGGGGVKSVSGANQPRPRKPRPGQVRIAKALDGTTLFCCPECHMAYPEKDALEQHLVVHKIERRFICDTCGAGLKRKEHLERHKLGHNPDRPYICPVCSKGFKRKEHLNLHSVIHSGEKTEVCGECGKGFYRKDHLRKHAKSHLTKKIKEAAHAQAQTTLEQQIHIQTAQVSIPNLADLPNMPQVSVIPIGRPVIKAEVDVDDAVDEDNEQEDEDPIGFHSGETSLSDCTISLSGHGN